MSPRTLALSDTLVSYIAAHSLRETPEQAALRAVTDQHRMAVMRSSAEQIQFLALVMKLMGASRAIEVGVFTGYGALGFALALPEEGELWALDVSKEYTDIGKPYWDDAGVADKIKLRIAPALETLEYLLRAGQVGRFDFAYIDADKPSYAAYVDRCHALLRQGGLIAVDNTLWSGAVANPDANDPDTAAVKALNASLAHDKRFDLSLLPVGDGLTLLRKR
jgi:predicted O-methyltransferase YrrM